MMSEDELSLQEIREALRMADEKRLDPQLSQKQRELLELSALALRDAERLAVGEVVKENYLCNGRKFYGCKNYKV